MKNKLGNKRYILSLLVTVFGLLALISGTSFAVLRGNTTSSNTQVIKAGSVELLLTESFNAIDKPISAMEDPDGLLQDTVYEFNIRNIGSVSAKYDLKLEDSGTNSIADSYIKVGLEVNDEEMGPMKLSNVHNVIDSNTINKNEVIRYKMRLWVDKSQEQEFTSESIANFKIKVDAKQSEKKPEALVTFNPDGGTIPQGEDWDGSGNTATKSVIVGQAYGNLPTPTKEGYTFKGWNGKNYYNANDRNVVSSGVTKDNNDLITINTSSGAMFYNYFTHNLDIQEGENYIIVAEIFGASNITGYLALTSQDDSPTQFNNIILRQDFLLTNSNSVQVYKMKARYNATLDTGLRTFYSNGSSNTNELITFRISVLDDDQDVTSNNFKYEPYYIKSSTKVVQNANHTLKAIWEQNS